MTPPQELIDADLIEWNDAEMIAEAANRIAQAAAMRKALEEIHNISNVKGISQRLENIYAVADAALNTGKT